MEEEKKLEETKEEATEKTYQIPPDILVDCMPYVNDMVDGYIAVYENFQKILWTMRNRGVPAADAAAATVAISNKAAAKGGAKVPHKDPFEKDEGLEEESKDEETE